MLWCQAAFSNVTDTPVLWCQASSSDVVDTPVLWCQAASSNVTDTPMLWCHMTTSYAANICVIVLLLSDILPYKYPPSCPMMMLSKIVLFPLNFMDTVVVINVLLLKYEIFIAVHFLIPNCLLSFRFGDCYRFVRMYVL